MFSAHTVFLISLVVTSSPTPLPVLVVKSVTTSASDATFAHQSAIALVVVTGALALVTAFLFWSTRAVAQRTAEVARDTVESAKLADQHHQESLQPVLAIVGGSLRYVEELVRGQERVARTLASDGSSKLPLPAEGWKVEPRLKLFLRIKNIGFGPALNSKVWVKTEGYEALQFYVGNIGLVARDDTEGYFSHDVDTVERTDLPPEKFLPCKVTIEFYNVFQQLGSTTCVIDPDAGIQAVDFVSPPTVARVGSGVNITAANLQTPAPK